MDVENIRLRWEKAEFPYGPLGDSSHSFVLDFDQNRANAILHAKAIHDIRALLMHIDILDRHLSHWVDIAERRLDECRYWQAEVEEYERLHEENE